MGEGAPSNYFNYFTEVEEHFQKARGTALFLMSPLDWALVEGWKNAGVPLEAAVRGIDAAFEKFRSRKQKFRQVNSLAYCAQAVMAEAQAMADAGTDRPRREAAAPFTLEELRTHLSGTAQKVRALAGYEEVAASVERLAEQAEEHYRDLEDLERRLTVLEEKMGAIARTRLTDEDMVALRRELDVSLRPYRGKMTAEQISMLERQYIDRRVLEAARLPRLSLFYLV